MIAAYLVAFEDNWPKVLTTYYLLFYEFCQPCSHLFLPRAWQVLSHFYFLESLTTTNLKTSKYVNTSTISLPTADLLFTSFSLRGCGTGLRRN